MARVRDYKAEEARRNARAKAAGYTSRAQLRRAIETGKRSPAKPERLKSPKTIAAYRARLMRAMDWVALHHAPNQGVTDFDIHDAADHGLTEAEYLDAFMNAFVEGPERYAAVRHKGGSPALHYWFVDLFGLYTDVEYDERYRS